LGPVKDHETVKNAKLTEIEKNELEQDITLDELTQSINNANMSSAPGADGISNRFIKHFWEFFKTPLLKLCQSCYAKGELPNIFRSANIKLTPKKGNLEKLTNWRPISLLNCFYKIISRVITRLKKFMDKMTPICQKGYSSSRYCQEVLMSVMESIEKCNYLKRKAAVLSLDIKKAFDSLSHSYLARVYEFYNFGPNLICWITLLSTKRHACVILDNMLTTDFFNLERGNAQGDTISPFLFNLGYQLLLFKLELSLQIK
jgi:Reverse transcriptase (RNA-dependent DNA polymerase)